MTMTNGQEIRNASEATTAKERANLTTAATVPLLKALTKPGLSERERAAIQEEIARLREQYSREIAPVRAFYDGLGRKAKGVERALESKDPEIERLRAEMAHVLERKGENEGEEITRIRAAFERRREELARQ